MSLWDTDHPYYASESNYYTNDWPIRFSTWAEFYESWGDNDRDLNLLIRWDWTKRDPADYEDEPFPETDELQLTFVLQRKGIYAPAFVEVTEADEPAIREWLAKRWETVVANWSPISGTVAT